MVFKIDEWSAKLAVECLDVIEDTLKQYISSGANIPTISRHLIGLGKRLNEPQFKEKPDPLKALLFREGSHLE